MELTAVLITMHLTGRKTKESLTVSLRPGHKMHWAFTLQAGTINYCCSFEGRAVSVTVYGSGCAVATR